MRKKVVFLTVIIIFGCFSCKQERHRNFLHNSTWIVEGQEVKDDSACLNKSFFAKHRDHINLKIHFYDSLYCRFCYVDTFLSESVKLNRGVATYTVLSDTFMALGYAYYKVNALSDSNMLLEDCNMKIYLNRIPNDSLYCAPSVHDVGEDTIWKHL